MSVKIYIPSSLQPLTSNLEVAEVNGNTIGDCLRQLVKQFPNIENVVFTGDKRIGVIGLHINRSKEITRDLAKPVKDGDELHLLYMLSGG